MIVYARYRSLASGLVRAVLVAALCWIPGAAVRAQQPSAFPADSKSATSGVSNDSTTPPVVADLPVPGENSQPLPAADPAAASATPNLLGQTDAQSGESRRNENVQFNLINNNAQKEVSVRLGTRAVIVDTFEPDRSYFGAEVGANPSSTIHLSESPVRRIHGRLFYSHLNSLFSARSFFQVGAVKPARENEYGYGVSIPLWRGASFTSDARQQKIRGNVNGNVLVPRPEERTPLTNDPLLRPFVARLLNAYPLALPNRTDIDPRALNTNSPQLVDSDMASGRLDQALGAADRLSLLYRFTAQSIEAFQFVAGQNPDTDTKAHSARLTWARAWSPATTTSFSAGFDRLRSLLVPEKNAVGPFILMAGALTELGPGSDIPIDRAQNSFVYGGNWRQVRGNHQLTVGSQITRQQINGSETDAHRGAIAFRNDFGRDAITNLRMGTPSQYFISMGHIHRGFRFWDTLLYFGDTWRAHPNLTLNFALRYQPVSRPVEVNGFNTVPYNCDCNNLAPQGGFAWRLPSRWGTVRAAYGLQYGEVFPVTFQQLRFNAPHSYKIILNAPDLRLPYGGIDPARIDPTTRSTIYVIDPELAVPYSHQYNFSWDLEPARNWKLQLGYVGSRSHKLFLMWYQNRAALVPGIPQTTATIDQRRPNPDYYDIRRVLNGSRGYYDAARVTLNVPEWRGLTLETSYWFSKAIDTATDYMNTASERDARLGRSQWESPVLEDMKGLSGFDQPHSLLMRGSWAAPPVHAAPAWMRALAADWSLSAVALLKSGTPFNVSAGSDAPGFGNVDGQSGDRPHVVEPVVLGRTVGHPDTSQTLLPRSAFAFMDPFERRGNLGRNTFRKGPIRNVNASLARGFAIRGERRLLLRAESVNFLNTPQFAEPGLELASPNFGRITNTLNDGRTFRLSMELAF